MKINELKKLCISNLILIILNEENDEFLRKCAEIELKRRIKNLGWRYENLLHINDKVIKERGLDVNNYLFSENVTMQQLMETYFMYVKGTTGDTIRLLFSEKHLCNEMGFAEPFFRKICSKEIENIDKRLNNNNNIESEKELLLSVKEMLLEGQKGEKQEFNLYRNNPANLPCANNTMDQLGQDVFLEFLTNHSDEELYDIYSSKLGTLKGMILSTLNMIELIDSDLVQNLYGLKFVEKDSSKLKKQKKKLLQEIKDCNSIDYEKHTMKKALQKVKKPLSSPEK